MRGRAKIKDVAADLGVTPSAVRLQLTQLQASGAIPIVMGPDVTASAAQTTRHIELNNSLPW